MSAAHTPTPWKLSNGSPLLICSDDFWIAGIMGIPSDEGEANARFIVRAVNCHDELLAAVIQYRDDLRHPPSMDSVQRRLAMVNELIAKATGGAA